MSDVNPFNPFQSGQPAQVPADAGPVNTPLTDQQGPEPGMPPAPSLAEPEPTPAPKTFHPGAVVTQTSVDGEALDDEAQRVGIVTAVAGGEGPDDPQRCIVHWLSVDTDTPAVFSHDLT